MHLRLINFYPIAVDIHRFLLVFHLFGVISCRCLLVRRLPAALLTPRSTRRASHFQIPATPAAFGSLLQGRGKPQTRERRDKSQGGMHRSSVPLLRFLRSRSLCSSSSGGIVAPKIDPVVYPFQGPSFRWRQQCLQSCPGEVWSKSVDKCKFLGFVQHVRCLGSRANVLMNVNASDGEMKKGSWTCPKCQFINSAQHQRCMGCQEPDSISVSRSPTFGFSLGADSHNTRRIGLPQSIVKYCVLRSPHIDKKSREQFEMRIKKLYMVVKTRNDDLQRKFFWLKRQRILGAQYEIIFSYKTRLPLRPGEQECP